MEMDEWCMVGPATATAAWVLDDVNAASIQLRVVQLGHRVLHVSKCSKLRNPVTASSSVTQQQSTKMPTNDWLL